MTTSKGKTKHKYKLRFMPEALEEWRNLDGSVQANLKKLLAKRLDNPRVPGGELHGPLAGCYKIKRKRSINRVPCTIGRGVIGMAKRALMNHCSAAGRCQAPG